MTETNQVAPKRTYKDSLFRRIFGEKKALLSLYNAVNGTAYENPEDLEINTLDNAVYLNVKNDLSFIFDFQINLYEHQSTYNGNMPLHYLYFITKLYQPMIGERAIYTSKRIMLPAPIFVVFYNSAEERPERWIEKLSDAFEVQMDAPKLELEVLVLNVNYGKNKELMEQCQMLKEYAMYVAKVRTYAEIMSTKEAVERAVIECIDENILADFLSRYRSEAVQMSILEYDEEKDLRLMRKAEREIGMEEGSAKMLVSMIRKKIEKGFASKDIADILDLEPDFVYQVSSFIINHSELDSNEITEKLLHVYPKIFK
ncbi:hypothetical protein LJC58_07600 [Lachnospiraceae bacterium OttesenSCG-928-D06]|nr:hypothetical protein [Lachnospiraceae bacterium OttesenSCG-928-D06]